MIKAKFEGKDGKPVFFFGLIAENIKRLLDGGPILIDLKQINDVGKVMLVYGENEQAIMKEMKDRGVLPADFNPEPGKMHHVIVKGGSNEEKKD